MKRYILLLILPFALLATAQERTTRIHKSMTILTDVIRQLDINYVDTLNYDALTEEAIRSMLRKVDPYTVYISKADDDNLRLMTTGKYGGIGAMIMQRDSIIMVHELYEHMPAQENGLLPGDELLEVDGVSCKGKTTKQVSELLRGMPESEVTVLIRREGADSIQKSFLRREIHLPAIGYYTGHPEGSKGGTGYILFSEFTTGSAMDLFAAVDEMVKKDSIQRLVIDLRGNGGGLIDEAIQLVGLFVDKGTEVVTTKGKTATSNRSYTTSISPYFRDMPLVILVNGQTASAAEIVSGGLQDLGRAKLIGERTFGKGLVQSVRPIAFDGHLKVTTAHYYLPSGRCIQAIDYAEQQKGNALKRDSAGGILPDIVMTDSQKVDISYSLYVKHMFFDFANRYYRQHEHIASPETFAVTDEDVEDFIRMLDEKNFVYETETSHYYNQMLKVAEEEDLDSTTLQQLRDMKDRLKPSYREAIYRHKDEIKRLMAADIVERYYYNRGRIAFLLREDEEMKRALELIEQDTTDAEIRP